MFQLHATPVDFLASSSVPKGYSIAYVVKGQLSLAFPLKYQL